MAESREKKRERESVYNLTPLGRLKAIRQRAKKSGTQFDITVDDINLAGNCPCCLTLFCEPSNSFSRSGPRSYPPNYPTIDRVNNSLGYSRSNVRTICMECNILKSSHNARSARHQALHLLKIADYIDYHNHQQGHPQHA